MLILRSLQLILIFKTSTVQSKYGTKKVNNHSQMTKITCCLPNLSLSLNSKVSSNDLSQIGWSWNGEILTTSGIKAIGNQSGEKNLCKFVPDGETYVSYHHEDWVRHLEVLLVMHPPWIHGTGKLVLYWVWHRGLFDWDVQFHDLEFQLAPIRSQADLSTSNGWKLPETWQWALGWKRFIQ